MPSAAFSRADLVDADPSGELEPKAASGLELGDFESPSDAAAAAAAAPPNAAVSASSSLGVVSGYVANFDKYRLRCTKMC